MISNSQLLIDPQLVSAISTCHRDWTVDAASNLIANFPDDRIAEIHTLKGALFIRNDVKPPMNRLFFDDLVIGEYLDEILDAAKRFGISFNIGVHPYLDQMDTLAHENNHLIAKLIKHGFVYTSQSFLWVKATDPVSFDAKSDVEVRIYGKDRLEEYFSVWYEGDANTLENTQWIKREVALFRSDHWFRYIFFFQGKPAATSIAYHNGNVFSCFYHETRAPFRRRGLQQCSLQFRTQHAHKLGCSYITGATAPQNVQSQRNFQRNDFQIACNWSQLTWRA
ncbi:MAG: hypothetical protein AAF558_02150 [Verrucomicrobiota bacterium]